MTKHQLWRELLSNSSRESFDAILAVKRHKTDEEIQLAVVVCDLILIRFQAEQCSSGLFAVLKIDVKKVGRRFGCCRPARIRFFLSVQMRAKGTELRERTAQNSGKITLRVRHFRIPPKKTKTHFP